MKKTIIIIGIVIALIVGVVATLLITRHKSSIIAPVDTIVNPSLTVKQPLTGTHCFAYHQVSTKDAPYAVDEYLTLNINGTQVTGNKKGNQSGPDMTNGYSGSLSGTITGDTITVNYAYTVEGSKNTEQEIYKITPTGMNKLQYPLIDHYKDGLVPDTTQEYKTRAYTSVACAQPIAMCYSYDRVTSRGYHDKETLTLMIDGEKVTGEYKYQPAEKDSKTGTFEGVVGPMDPKISARTADVWWNVAAEGMQAIEQLKIQFGEGSAVALFGEMKDGDDGRYLYAHPNKLTPGFQMDQKDCTMIK